MARNWADLLPELLGLCSQHLCLKDLCAFRAVCRSWRSAAVKKRIDVPWLMLADKKGSKGWREFFCLPSERVLRKSLPEAKGKRCFSSRGWLLTIGKDWEVHMLNNPMSHGGSHVIKLPHLRKFPDVEEEFLREFHHHVYGAFIEKFVLSASPTTSSDYRVMVVYDNVGRLGLWKPGDEEWTAVTAPRSHIQDVIFYKGCYFALNSDASILRCDVKGSAPYKAQVVFQLPLEFLGCQQGYLVQSTTGSLLMVKRRGQKTPGGRSLRFHVFEIDLEKRSWKGVKTLNNTSLFLGSNSSFSLEGDENLHIKPNCIYFTDDFLDFSRHTKDGGGKDMGIYHLEDRSIEPHFRGKSYSHLSPPLWIKPEFDSY